MHASKAIHSYLLLLALLDDVADVSITVSRGVVSTLEVHNATNLKLRLEDQSQEQSRVPGSETSASYGTLTLDPHLDNVTVLFGKPSDIGAIILTKPSHAAPSRSLNNVTLGIDSEDTFSLLSSMENEDERNQLDGGQRHFFYDSGWKEKELVRKEKDYPSLVQ